MSINHNLPASDLIDEYFNERFLGNDYIYTENGRKAINIALQFYELKTNDVVTIVTTSGNFYISGCVTKEIEKFCKWSRNIEDSTKLIFVNHEFGHPYTDLKQLKKYKLPIIEDCAGSFFSKDRKNEIGNIGDFVVYSFPKMFPLQIGGLLVCNLPERLEKVNQIPLERLRHVKNVLSNHIKNKEKIIQDRINNYYFLKDKFESLGFLERFQLDSGIVPGVFMFRNISMKFSLPDLKKYFYAHGIQCSVFYGEESFYIPVHQALDEYDMLYFHEVMKSFLQRPVL
jgi:hypothetical protein